MRFFIALCAIFYVFAVQSQTLKVRGKITANGETLQGVDIKFFASNNKLLSSFATNNGYYQCDLPYYDRYIVHIEKKGFIVSPIMVSTLVPKNIDWDDMWRVFRLDLDMSNLTDTTVFMSEKVHYNARNGQYFRESSRTPTIIGEYMNNEGTDRPYRKLNQLVINAFDNPAFEKKKKLVEAYERAQSEKDFNAIEDMMGENNVRTIDDNYFDQRPPEPEPEPIPEPVKPKPNVTAYGNGNLNRNTEPKPEAEFNLEEEVKKIEKRLEKEDKQMVKQAEPKKVNYENEEGLERLWSWIKQVETEYKSSAQSNYLDAESVRRKGGEQGQSVTPSANRGTKRGSSGIQGPSANKNFKPKATTASNTTSSSSATATSSSTSASNSNVYQGSTVSADANIYFTINIGVYKHRKKKFDDVYGGIGQYLVNQYNDLSYHSIGKFNTIREVDFYIEKVRRYVPKAFVTAWKNGKRIPVEQAEKLTTGTR